MNQQLKMGRFDYLLGAVATLTVLIAAGYSLRLEGAAWVLAGISATGYLFSSLRPANEVQFRRITPDGLAYAIAAFACLSFTPQLNSLLPGGGFPPQLLYASSLCWVLAVGSLFVWRDSTLLFQAVPAIALYGLVGVFETFAPAPFLFFVFLICSGVLFARAHLRNMLRLAAQAGEADVARLRQYAWRSIAGPEWAFTSAVAVVALSALFAPLIRLSMQDATAPLRVPVRVAANAVNQATAGSAVNPARDNVPVGNGPFGRPSETPVMVADMTQEAYLRGEAYYVFNGRSWRAMDMQSRVVNTTQRNVFDVASANPDFNRISENSAQVRYQLIASGPSLPGPYLPGETSAVRFRGRAGISLREDGLVLFGGSADYGQRLEGIGVLPAVTPSSRLDTPNYWTPELNAVELSPRVANAVQQALRGADTDLEKVEALKRLVTSRITYNLQAERVPPDVDLVDHVLFESQEGYCDLFATTLAILARSEGMASRVAVGYLVSPHNLNAPGSYLIRQADYHMWTEVYFEGAGWIPFDATEGAAEVPGNGRGMPWRESEAWHEHPAVRNAGNVLIVVSILGLLVALFGDAIRTAARRWRGGTAPAAELQREADALAMGVLKSLERASDQPRRFPETASEYLARLAREFPTLETELRETANAVNAALYAPASETVAEWLRSNKAATAVKQLRKNES